MLSERVPPSPLTTLPLKRVTTAGRRWQDHSQKHERHGAHVNEDCVGEEWDLYPPPVVQHQEHEHGARELRQAEEHEVAEAVLGESVAAMVRKGTVWDNMGTYMSLLRKITATEETP